MDEHWNHELSILMARSTCYPPGERVCCIMKPAVGVGLATVVAHVIQCCLLAWRLDQLVEEVRSGEPRSPGVEDGQPSSIHLSEAVVAAAAVIRVKCLVGEKVGIE